MTLRISGVLDFAEDSGRWKKFRTPVILSTVTIYRRRNKQEINTRFRFTPPPYSDTYLLGPHVNIR
jgi:hypothetical protein